MEDAIKSTLNDARKIEEQISTILAALQNENLIKEADLLHLPSAEDIEQLVEPLRKNAKLGGGKTAVSTSSQIKRKSKEIDSAPIPMDVGSDVRIKDVFKLIESSLFLLTVVDEWILGMTLVNSSEIAQNSPELVLSISPTDVDQVNKPCRVFQYSTQVNLLDVKYESIQNRNAGKGIPYHDSFKPQTSKKLQTVQPDCQVLITSTFQHPLHFMGTSNSLNLLVSLMQSGIQLWSRSIPVEADNLAVLRANENNFLLHQVSILTAIGNHKEYFKMNRLLSQGDKIPHRAVEKFLRPIGFDKLSSETAGIDTIIDIYGCIKNFLSPLWGTMFKLEKCSRNVNSIRCVLTTRSAQQHDIFLRLFQQWCKKEDRHERNQGMTGLSLLPVISPTDHKNVLKAVQSEIQVISELIERNQKKKRNYDSEEWFIKFTNAASETDDIFMNYLN